MTVNAVQLVVSNQQVELGIKEYRGARVVTFKDVDQLHKRSDGTARVTFNRHKDRFQESEDYFVCHGYEAEKLFGTTAPNGMTLLTETGYLMLTKPFNDDISWQAQRQLVQHYFRTKSIPWQDSRMRQLDVEAKLRNAKTRQAKLMKEMARDFQQQLAPESIQLLIGGATELIMGRQLLPKPQIDVHFTATEIAEELGITANKVGRVANKAEIKTPDNGKWILDKSRHAEKQVRTFIYNVRGRQAIVDALKSEGQIIPLKTEE